MSIRRVFLLIGALSAMHASASSGQVSKLPALYGVKAPMNIIFDTDIWTDFDDALALAMLHALEDRGEAKLLAVTISTNDRSCASYVDLINTFYGRPSIPIGMIDQGMDLEFYRANFKGITFPLINYTKQVSERTRPNGGWFYPRGLSASSQIPSAMTVLRKTLAAQADQSVVLIQVGFSTNLARLLRSPPDEFSNYSGRELVTRKVRLLSVMAGIFSGTSSPETNLFVDPSSAQELFDNWPTPLIASGFEVGAALGFLLAEIEQDYSYLPDHPLAESSRAYCAEMAEKKIGGWDCTQPKGTFDLTAVLYAVRPDRNYFSLSGPGKIVVTNDGVSRFEASPDGGARFLILSEAQKERTREAMMMLATQPPGRVARP